MEVKITYHLSAGNMDTFYTITSKELFQDFCLILINMGFLIDSVITIKTPKPAEQPQA
jgi:hypothetical protein